MTALVLYALIIVIVAALIYSILTNVKKRREIIQGSLAVIAFVSGILIYYFGFESLSDSSDTQKLSAGLSAFWNALRMFINEDDRAILVESELFYNTPAVAPVFWITHLTAFSVTIVAVISTFAKKFINNRRIDVSKLLINDKTHYIIIGSGYAAKIFADNLHTSDKKSFVTYITGESDNADAYYDTLLEKGYAVINGKADKEKLQKAGAFLRNKDIKVIAMNENDEVNLEIGKMLAENPSFSENPGAFAYIMYSNTEKSDYFAFAEDKKVNGRVRFFNIYELCAREFFEEHPLPGMIRELIDTEKARLKGKFDDDKVIIKDDGSKYVIKSIFVGFGDQNFQMLKLNTITGQLLGTDFNAVVYDMDIEANEARFRHNAPGLFPDNDEDNNEYFENPAEKYNIVFKNMNVVSNDFTKDLVSEIAEADFTAIYVALGNDKLCAETADDIRLAVLRKLPSSAKNVRIFVKTAKHTIYSDCRSDGKIDISFFGYDSDILTPDNIIDADLDNLAKAIAGGGWETLTELKRNSNRMAAVHIKAKLNLMGFDLVLSDREPEDCTEAFLNKYCIDRAKTIKTESGDLSRVIDDEYDIDADKTDDNLARLEHQRWNAFHLVNGYTKLPKKFVNAKTHQDMKQHACLTTFKGLYELRNMQAEMSGDTGKTGVDFDTIKYDYSVMDNLSKILNKQKTPVRYFITSKESNSEDPKKI
jgi:hypothetical protein